MKFAWIVFNGGRTLSDDACGDRYNVVVRFPTLLIDVVALGVTMTSEANLLYLKSGSI